MRHSKLPKRKQDTVHLNLKPPTKYTRYLSYSSYFYGEKKAAGNVAHVIFVFGSLPSVYIEQLNLCTMSFTARLKLVTCVYIENWQNRLSKTVHGCAYCSVL